MVNSLSLLCGNCKLLNFYNQHDYYALAAFIDFNYNKYFKYKGYKEYYNYYKYLQALEDNSWFLHLEESRALIPSYKSNPEKLWGLLKFVVIVESIKKSGNFEVELKDFITPIYERFSKYLPLPRDNELLLSDQKKFNLIEDYFNNEINELNKIYKKFISSSKLMES